MKQPYSIQQYSLDAVTISVDAEVPAHLKSILDLRAVLGRGTPLLPASPFQPEFMRLAELGFDYIDIGTHSSWIAAEIPVQKIRSQLVFEEAGKQLLAVKGKIEQLAGKKKTSR